MKPGEMLDTAKGMVNGPRDEHYGHPRDNFQRIADLWSVVFKREVTIEEVAMCMVLLKVARLINRQDHVDSWLDIAGYVGAYDLTREPVQ
jgi:hypothetical protein